MSQSLSGDCRDSGRLMISLGNIMYRWTKWYRFAYCCTSICWYHRV